jgi:NAD+ synthase
MTDVPDPVGRTVAPDLPRDDDGFATGPEAVSRLRESLPAFVAGTAAELGADRAVVILDGRLATTVTATVAVEALGAESVTGLVLPAYMSQEATARTAEAIATALEVEYTRIHLQPILAAFQELVGTAGEPADDLVAMRNAAARFRMACSYYVADTTNALVVGGATRTDRLLGTVTKHADTGVDCLPLGDRYATEVRALADALEIPEDIVEDPSRSGRFDAADLGLATRDVDLVLRLLVDEARTAAAVADRVGVDREAVERIASWYENTHHVRRHPSTPLGYDRHEFTNDGI